MSYIYDHELNIYSLPSGTPLQKKLQHISGTFTPKGRYIMPVFGKACRRDPR